MNFILCRKIVEPQWSNFNVILQEIIYGQLVGPYVAKSDDYTPPARTPKTENEHKEIRVYDASKAVRAGRDVTGATLAANNKAGGATVSWLEPAPAVTKLKATKNTKVKKAAKPAQQQKKPPTRVSNSKAVNFSQSDDTSST